MKFLQVIGLLLAIVALVLLAYYGVGALPAALVAALIVMLTNQINIWQGFSEFFMGKVANPANSGGWFTIIPVDGVGTVAVGSGGGYIKFFYDFFLIFASSTLFAKLYEDSGAASALALFMVEKFGKKPAPALLSFIIVSILLTWGGVSLFVVVFAMYPMVLILGRETNMPKKIFIGGLMIGAATITMTCLPASPQLTNIIPTKTFGTTLNASPILGILAGLAIAGLGYWYMVWSAKKAAAKGEGFVPGPRDDMSKVDGLDRSKLPTWWMTLIPIVLVLLINIIVPTVLRRYDANRTAYYLGRWDATKTVVASMVLAAAVTLVLFWKHIPNKLKSINEGLQQAAPACANVAAVVGFGAVVIATGGIAVANAPLAAAGVTIPGLTTSLDLYAAYMGGNAALKPAYDGVSAAIKTMTGYTNGGFAEFIRFVYNLNVHPYYQAFIGIEVLAGVVGSSSGGLSIGLPVLQGAGVFGNMVDGRLVYHAGTSAETFHRLTAIAAGGLDTLPHTGGVFLALAVFQVTHKEAYKYIFVTSVLIPVVIAFLATTLAVIFKF